MIICRVKSEVRVTRAAPEPLFSSADSLGSVSVEDKNSTRCLKINGCGECLCTSAAWPHMFTFSILFTLQKSDWDRRFESARHMITKVTWKKPLAPGKDDSRDGQWGRLRCVRLVANPQGPAGEPFLSFTPFHPKCLPPKDQQSQTQHKLPNRPLPDSQ